MTEKRPTSKNSRYTVPDSLRRAFRSDEWYWNNECYDHGGEYLEAHINKDDRTYTVRFVQWRRSTMGDGRLPESSSYIFLSDLTLDDAILTMMNWEKEKKMSAIPFIGTYGGMRSARPDGASFKKWGVFDRNPAPLHHYREVMEAFKIVEPPRQQPPRHAP